MRVKQPNRGIVRHGSFYHGRNKISWKIERYPDREYRLLMRVNNSPYSLMGRVYHTLGYDSIRRDFTYNLLNYTAGVRRYLKQDRRH